jgi:hypothetical protein
MYGFAFTFIAYAIYDFARFTHLERDPFRLNHFASLTFCLRMIFSENRFPLFGIMR